MIGQRPAPRRGRLRAGEVYRGGADGAVRTTAVGARCAAWRAVVSPSGRGFRDEPVVSRCSGMRDGLLGLGSRKPRRGRRHRWCWHVVRVGRSARRTGRSRSGWQSVCWRGWARRDRRSAGSGRKVRRGCRLEWRGPWRRRVGCGAAGSSGKSAAGWLRRGRSQPSGPTSVRRATGGGAGRSAPARARRRCGRSRFLSPSSLRRRAAPGPSSPCPSARRSSEGSTRDSRSS
jgi:hypothetical protein